MTNNDITSRQHIISPEALAVLGDGKIAYLVNFNKTSRKAEPALICGAASWSWWKIRG